MAHAIAYRVWETTTTTGTGTLDLGGAKTGYQTFVAGVGDGNTTYYCIQDGTDWEIGIGTVTDAATDTLSRDTVLQSSNSDAAVNWSAGTKQVFAIAGLEEYTTLKSLTDSASIDWDLALEPLASVTLGGNRTVAAPTNVMPGAYVLYVNQDGTGSRTLTWNSAFKWAGGTAPTLTTSAGAADIIVFVSDGTNLYGAEKKEFG